MWANAAVVDDLHQVTPIEYAEPDERTEILILYDDDALYIAARLYDTDPEQITARNMRQNDNLGQDDRFYVTIDPFNDRRSGYFFGLNPNGVRADGLYRNVTEFYGEWDSIYDAAAGRFEGGWTAEIEIPYKSISFDPTTDTWGLNFSRTVVRKNEVIAWVSRNRAYNPAVSGLAVGFEGLEQGIGLEIVPSLAVSDRKNFLTGETDSDTEPSLDMAYRITPQLNGSLTINTDFSVTEVDDRQVNLTRLGLFFPEKRDFFLREADIFEFGGIGGQRQSSIPGLNTLAQNGRPFFSRRIGLSNDGRRSSTSSTAASSRGASAAGRSAACRSGRTSTPSRRCPGREPVGAECTDLAATAGAHARASFRPIRCPSRARSSACSKNRTSASSRRTAARRRRSTTRSRASTSSIATRACRAAARSSPTCCTSRATPTAFDGDDDAYGASVRFPSSQGMRGILQYRSYERAVQSGARLHRQHRHQRYVLQRRLHACGRATASSSRGSRTSTISASTT